MSEMQTSEDYKKLKGHLNKAGYLIQNGSFTIDELVILTNYFGRACQKCDIKIKRIKEEASKIYRDERLSNASKEKTE